MLQNVICARELDVPNLLLQVQVSKFKLKPIVEKPVHNFVRPHLSKAHILCKDTIEQRYAFSIHHQVVSRCRKKF